MEQVVVAPAAGATSSHARRKWLGVGAIAVAAIAAGSITYWRSVPHAEATTPAADVPRLDGKWIRYSPEFAMRSKIEFATCETGSLSPIVSVTGTVAFDPHLVAAIGARIAGRVRNVRKFDGDHVVQGDVLAEIESAELGQAQAGLLSARARAEAAEANEKRESILAEQRISSQRDAELAKATASAARAEVAAVEQKLRALGGSATGPVGVLLLTSPIAGKVVELGISRGQFVEPSHTAVRVADLSRVWIDLAVFERDLGRIKLEDKVEISPQADLGVTVAGTVAHVGDVIDLDTRSAPVRVVVDNTDESLRPGQSVVAKIHTAKTTEHVPMIPLESLTSVDGKPTVFVAHDDTSVEPRTIVVGSKDAKHVLVASGLSPGERVAVAGVFALKAEVFR
jgi:cobalt-zinc-cadmium efflux system membrane fusion protein